MFGHFPVNLRFPVLFLSQLPITGSVKLQLFFTVNRYAMLIIFDSFINCSSYLKYNNLYTQFLNVLIVFVHLLDVACEFVVPM